MQNVWLRGNDWHRPVTEAPRPRGQLARAATFALTATVLALLARPSGAEEVREHIPDGCRELANRAGLPLTLTHAEALRAIAYLSIMSSSDPAVARCRAAMLRR